MNSFHSNAYFILLSSHLSISVVFNVEDLTFYRCTFAHPKFSASARGGSATSSLSIPKMRPAPPSVVNDGDAKTEDEILSAGIRRFQRLLVHLKGRPQSDDVGVDTNYN